MKKIIALVLVAMVATGAFFYGRSYERENYKYEFSLTESEKELLRESFLASGATMINDDLFEISWSEGEENYTTRLGLSGSISEKEARLMLLLFSELACYLDMRPEGREVTSGFINSDCWRLP